MPRGALTTAMKSHMPSSLIRLIPLCTCAALVASSMARADDWPQFRGPNRDSVWNETGIMQTFPADGLKIRWRAPIGGGISSPVVAQGRVYVTDSLEEKPKAWERVHCFDEKTGTPLWTYSYEADYLHNWGFKSDTRTGPYSTPIVEAGKLYALGILGDVVCLDAVTGALAWKKKLTEEYELGDYYTAPSLLVEGGLMILIIGGKPNACVVALDKNSGKEVWHALSDRWTYSSPIVITAGGQRQLIVWTLNAVTSLNPATGKTWWRQELGVAGTLSTVPMPVFKGDLLLLSGLMFQLDPAKPAAFVLWPERITGTKRILSQTSIPIMLGDHVFSGKMPGKLVCLEARTGNQVWETDKVTVKSSGATIHLTPNGDSVLIFTDEGNLIRARLTPQGYEELSRAHVIEPTTPFGGRKVVWPPPAYANRHIFVRNDEELVCASLATQ